MEVLGKNPQILNSGEHDHGFYQKMWASLSAGKTWHGRFVNKKKNGSLYTEEATISPVLDPSGNIINYVAVKRDITKEQALEQQYLEAQKMEAIGTLAGGIAHDFNNILAISRRGRQEKIIMNLKPIVKETIGLLRASLPSTIRLEPHIAADTGMLFADPTQMQQVLMNLCTNAAHAMEKEGGVLKVTLSKTSIGENDAPLEPGSPPGEYVKLSVSDTGHGMQPWILKRIFEPYFTTKETGKGTGLGLSVAHGIVKSHGGAVKVSSVVRKWSVFEIYLPRVKGEAAETDKFDLPLLTGTGRILFVDDEPALTLMGQKILGRLGYRVQTTNSSVEALEIFRSKPNEVDLVITDLTMPELTGINLAKEIPMSSKLMNYFNKQPRLGTLSTSSKDGKVNSAYFGSPFMVDDKTIIMGLAKNRTLVYLQENPNAVFTIMEPGKTLSEWGGVRIYVKMTDCSTTGEKLEKIKAKIAAAAGEGAAKMIHAAVVFEVHEIRPLADFGQGWEKSIG